MFREIKSYSNLSCSYENIKDLIKNKARSGPMLKHGATLYWATYMREILE